SALFVGFPASHQDLKNARSSSISDPRARSRWSCRRPIDWGGLVGAGPIKSGSWVEESVVLVWTAASIPGRACTEDPATDSSGVTAVLDCPPAGSDWEATAAIE